MQDQVFISYRVGDVDNNALEISVAINDYFGKNSTYEFRKNNIAGEDFPQRLALAVSRAKVVLAIIGPNWGKPRSENEKVDWVEVELKDALNASIPIIPIFIGNINAVKDIKNQTLSSILNKYHILNIPDTNSDSDYIKNFLTILEKKYKIKKQNKSMDFVTPNTLKQFLSPREYFLFSEKEGRSRVIYASLDFLFVLFISFVLLQILLRPMVSILQITSNAFEFIFLSFPMLLTSIFLIILATFPSRKNLIYWPLINRIVFCTSTLATAIICISVIPYLVAITMVQAGTFSSVLLRVSYAQSSQGDSDVFSAIETAIGVLQSDNQDLLSELSTALSIGIILGLVLTFIWTVRTSILLKKILRRRFIPFIFSLTLIFLTQILIGFLMGGRILAAAFFF